MSLLDPANHEVLSTLLDFSVLSNVLQQVLASLARQTARADKLEAEVQQLTSQQSALSQLESVLTRLSAAEESLKAAHTSASTLTNAQHAQQQHLASHSASLSQHGVTLKELQTNAALVLGQLEGKADAAELDKKASALKLQQVERMALQQAQGMERLRDKVSDSERDCATMRERVQDSAAQRERLIQLERDTQQHTGELHALQAKQDDWERQLAGFESTESVAARMAAVEDAVRAAAKEQHLLNKREMKRFERDVVAYINQQHPSSHPSSHHASTIHAHPADPSSSPSALPASGHLHTGLTRLSLPSAPVDSAYAASSLAAATAVQVKCLSCASGPADTQASASSLQLASAAAQPDHAPLTERARLLHAQWVDSVTIGDQTYITGVDGNVYRGQRPHTADASRSGTRAGRRSQQWDEAAEEKEADVLAVAAADRSESMLFAEETRRRQTLEARKRETGGGTISNFKPQRLMLNGTGQVIRATNGTNRELKSARVNGSSASRR